MKQIQSYFQNSRRFETIVERNPELGCSRSKDERERLALARPDARYIWGSFRSGERACFYSPRTKIRLIPGPFLSRELPPLYMKKNRNEREILSEWGLWKKRSACLSRKPNRASSGFARTGESFQIYIYISQSLPDIYISLSHADGPFAGSSRSGR